MFPSAHVHVDVDLARIRANALAIAERTKVDVIAVVKADAYGLGTARVAKTLGDVVAGFCVFSLSEAQEASLWDVAHRPILSLGPAEISGNAGGADAFVRAHVRPAVWSAEQARALAAASPVLCLDTGMQRFSCPPKYVDELLATADFSEAFTHALNVNQARMLAERFAGSGMKLHAAGSALLDEPSAWLDAVRPGIALYRGAARVHTRLVEVRNARGSAGYTGFQVDRFGIILCGYSNGLRPGLCLVNGEARRVLEVGMQSAFVEINAGDKAGDEVVLLGDSLSEADQAKAWKTSEQQVMVGSAGAGIRAYKGP